MAQVSGQVNQIKGRQTQYGEMFDVVVNGQAYGLGKYAPRGINPGDFVTLEFEQKGNFRNIVKGSLRKDTDNQTTAPAPASPTSAATTPYVAKQPYVAFDERQEMISKQAALNTALSFANLAVANGAVPMPKAVKESDKLGLIHQWVLDTAASFYKLSTGRDWAMPEASPAGIEKPATKTPAKAKAASEDTGYDEYQE